MNSPIGPTPTGPDTVHRYHWRPWRYIRVRPRLMTSTVVFLIAGTLLLLGGMRVGSALMLGFDLGALLYLVALARMFAHSSQEHLARQARLQDTGRRGTLAVTVMVSLMVLTALATELHAAKGGSVTAVLVAAATVVLSWLFMNTSFALHYAHSYYGDGDRACGGLEFPGTPAPDYWDFVYFSFVIGMCFQTSDVTVAARHMRHVTLLHSVVAFFFNVFILAISVSVVGGLGS
ncbi:DUF1345 domain-containing protein [Dyella sp. A6]|uniref:DUF1345 domain-containing protein n=1 Tax=Dyella aluminiiresistens TaxID=3069105 RepID=UPI002E772989|nr:DUF1345 domain-containing protein [Dyella sp. A6]